METEIIEDHRPLLVEIYREKMTSEESATHRAKILEILDRGERFGMLADMRYSLPESVEDRKIDAQMMKDNHERLGRLSVGYVFVTDAALLRIAMNFVFFIAPPPMPTKVTKTIEEATPWLENRFKEEGLEFPETGRAYLEQLAKQTS